jgi:hypothetical protein
VKRSSSIIRVTGISEIGTTLTLTSNRRTLRRNTTYSISISRNIMYRISSQRASVVS